MIGEKMLEALNKQINEELYSSYLYLSMSAWFENIGLKGFANWMKVQAKEELGHAMKFYKYIISRGGRVQLHEIKAPPHEWQSPLHAFEETLKHEKHITECINKLVELAEEEKDRATFNMLQWFVDEQVEEEANDEEIIAKLKMIEGSNGIFMLDNQLAQRKYVEEVK
ncbi:MAG: ferritin [Thermoplasmata archaeon]|nr:MAG: ferritin [Thermoplasmata archaeon]